MSTTATASTDTPPDHGTRTLVRFAIFLLICAAVAIAVPMLGSEAAGITDAGLFWFYAFMIFSFNLAPLLISGAIVAAAAASIRSMRTTPKGDPKRGRMVVVWAAVLCVVVALVVVPRFVAIPVLSGIYIFQYQNAVVALAATLSVWYQSRREPTEQPGLKPKVFMWIVTGLILVLWIGYTLLTFAPMLGWIDQQ